MTVARLTAAGGAVAAAAAETVTTVDSCSAGGAVTVAGRQRSVVATAPDGYRITGYCVTVRGQGSEVHQLGSPSATAELTHSSGKAIEEYALSYERTSDGAAASDAGTPSPSTSAGDPTAEATEGAATDDAVDGTDRDVRNEAPDPMMDIDALLGNRENAEERARRPTPEAAAPTGVTPSALRPITFVAIVLVGLAAVGVVASLLLRRRRREAVTRPRDMARRVSPRDLVRPVPPENGRQPAAQHLARARSQDAAPPVPPDPDLGAPDVRTPVAEHRPRHRAPRFVAGDDSTDFPSLR